MMTLERFKKIPRGAVVRAILTEHELVEHGKYGKLWFVVKKGGGYDDWAIYYHKEEVGIDYVISNGDKVIGEGAILELFPCTKEVLNLYRR
jgi:hypothetical protein